MKQQLVSKARELVRIDGKPIYIFRELTQFLINQRCMAPGYSFSQDIIGQALDYEHDRLAAIVQDHLVSDDRAILARLVADTGEMYEITRLNRKSIHMKRQRI